MSKYRYGKQVTARLVLDNVSSRDFVLELVELRSPKKEVVDVRSLREAIEDLKELSQSIDALAVNFNSQISEIEDILEETGVLV